MNILFLTNAPILHSNGLGNTLLNIFGTLENVNIINIYCRYDKLDEKNDIRYFQITEKTLLANLKNDEIPSGKEVFSAEENGSRLNEQEQKGFDAGRQLRWQVLFWARDFIWKIGRWKSSELKDFLDETKPDVIFQTIFFSSYINDIALFIKQYTGVPMLGYMPDDNYSLRQFRFSPLYWIDRIWKRQKVKRTIAQCDLMYVISQIQKTECEKAFARPCKILTKSAEFSEKLPTWEKPGEVVRMLYAGNLGSGRWKSLGLITDAVEKLRSEGYGIEFNIYSATPQTTAMKSKLNQTGSSLNAAVPFEEVQKLQRSADILVHAEGLSLKSRMAVHQSFSTKLVDYFALGKCIFAVGTPDVASIHHLMVNDAAIVADNSDTVYIKLKELLDQPKLILSYGNKAYCCGAKNHNRRFMETMLEDDLIRSIRSGSIG